MANDHPDISGLPLAQAYNVIRGGIPFDRLAEAIDHAVSSQTLQRIGDAGRPFKHPVTPETLIGAADAVNNVRHRTVVTPWNLWVAHGIQFERTAGLWGRLQGDRAAESAHVLPPGWTELAHDRLNPWVRVGQAFVAEQEVRATELRIAEVEEENRRLRARLDATEHGP